MTNSLYANGFCELSIEEVMDIDGGLFDEICKGLTSFFGGAIIKGAVSGAITGSAAGPVGTIAGVVGGIVILYVWDKVF